MSDYKIVNGKKVRVCKYGCDTELVWSDEISGFIETQSRIAHTKDRCQEVKSKQFGRIDESVITLEQVLRKLETHGIIVNVQRLMAQ
jgi:hypothetical protein